MIDKAMLKTKLSELLKMCEDEEGGECDDLAAPDGGDGGSEGVTDLGGVPAASPMGGEKSGDKKRLNVIAMSIKKKMNKY